MLFCLYKAVLLLQGQERQDVECKPPRLQRSCGPDVTPATGRGRL